MPRFVSQAEFASIECNRCGACCTRFHLDSDPGQELERELALGARPASDRHVRDLATIADMALHLEDDPAGGAWYKCRHFRWEAPGLGACTIHERRPEMCRGFPYGREVPDIPTCSWNVRKVYRTIPVLLRDPGAPGAGTPASRASLEAHGSGAATLSTECGPGEFGGESHARAEQ